MQQVMHNYCNTNAAIVGALNKHLLYKMLDGVSRYCQPVSGVLQKYCNTLCIATLLHHACNGILAYGQVDFSSGRRVLKIPCGREGFTERVEAQAGRQSKRESSVSQNVLSILG